MFKTPLIVWFCVFLDLIIQSFAVICKKLFLLRPQDGFGNLTQSHFRNVAGGNAQGVHRGQGVEVVNAGEIRGFKSAVRLDAQSGHHHVGNADLQRLAVLHLYVQLIQFL
ncbi:MAG: hypothetical protein RSC08_06740 [Oscillospiraceae bacterium]